MRPSRLFLFAGVALAQFGLFEAGLRLHGGSEAAPGFQQLFMTDARMGYRLKPGAQTRFSTSEFATDIAINNVGVRDEPLGPKGPGERRIVVLGDSLVMSVQVPLAETFCRRLEVRLNGDAALAPYHYRVINAGVQGYGPVEDWLFYQHVASAFDADVVLVALYVANDAIEAADRSSRLAGEAAPAPPAQAREGLSRWVRRVVRRSMVLQIVRLRLVTLADHFGQAPGIERALTTYVTPPPDDVRRGLRVTRECVSRIAELAATRGARTAVVLLPARFQLDDEEFRERQGNAERNGLRLERDGANRLFAQALEGLPVPVLDALPVMRATPRSADLYFAETAHLTPRGHQVLADAIARFLLADRVLPAAAHPVAAGADR